MQDAAKKIAKAICAEQMGGRGMFMFATLMSAERVVGMGWSAADTDPR